MLADRSANTNHTNVLAGITINGSIRFKSDLIIDGKVDGDITSENGNLIIGENAHIQGSIKAGTVKVMGKIQGCIVSKSCELKTNALVKGDVTAGSINVEHGASLDGKVTIQK